MHGLLQEAINLEQNVVAICDVDENQIAAKKKAFAQPLAKAAAYRDYRELLAREKSVDAVLVATPDHWHALIAKAAMQAGKHVYCEKPLTHTIGEARELARVAQQTRVVTQTGNQGSASSNFRRSMELIAAGVLGTITDVHIWHPPHGWPSGVDRPEGQDVVPAGLDWQTWLGPAPERPFKTAVYHPAAWRGWFDFGGGSLADFCCHAFSMPVRALDLDAPRLVEVSGEQMAMDSFPKSCTVRFHFPKRGKRGPVRIHFYSGGPLPPAQVTAGLVPTLEKVPSLGCLVVGEKGILSAGLWNNECLVQVHGEAELRHADNHDVAKHVPRKLPRAPGQRHMLEWLDACRGQGKTFSPFEIGAHVTEIGAIGLLALRLGRSIEWDPITLRVKGAPEAKAWIQPQARAGWRL